MPKLTLCTCFLAFHTAVSTGASCVSPSHHTGMVLWHQPWARWGSGWQRWRWQWDWPLRTSCRNGWFLDSASSVSSQCSRPGTCHHLLLVRPCILASREETNSIPSVRLQTHVLHTEWACWPCISSPESPHLGKHYPSKYHMTCMITKVCSVNSLFNDCE